LKGRKTDALFRAVGEGQAESALWLLSTGKFKPRDEDGYLRVNHAKRSYVDVCRKSNKYLKDALVNWGSGQFNDQSARLQGVVHCRKTPKERREANREVPAKRKQRASKWEAEKEQWEKQKGKGSHEPTRTLEPAHGKGSKNGKGSKRAADLQGDGWAAKQKK